MNNFIKFLLNFHIFLRIKPRLYLLLEFLIFSKLKSNFSFFMLFFKSFVFLSNNLKIDSCLQIIEFSVIIFVFFIVSLFINPWFCIKVLSFFIWDLFPSSSNFLHDIKHLHVRKCFQNFWSSLSNKYHVSRKTLFGFWDFFVIYLVLFF